jgi:hypothetical protein
MRTACGEAASLPPSRCNGRYPANIDQRGISAIATVSWADERPTWSKLLTASRGSAPGFWEGIDEIALDTWAANLDAQHFFGSQGFTVFNVVLRKKLARVG